MRAGVILLFAVLALAGAVAIGCGKGDGGLAEGESQPADSEPLVVVNAVGEIEFGPGDTLVFDDTTTVAADGETTKTSPNDVAFSGYELPARQLRQLKEMLSELDLAGLAAAHPPIDGDHVTTVEYEGQTFEIGASVGDDYDDPSAQQALFAQFEELIDKIGRKGYKATVGPLPYQD